MCDVSHGDGQADLRQSKYVVLVALSAGAIHFHTIYKIYMSGENGV